MGLNIKAGDRVYIPNVSPQIFTVEPYGDRLCIQRVGEGRMGFFASGYVTYGGTRPLAKERIPEVWPATWAVHTFFTKVMGYRLDAPKYIDNPATEVTRQFPWPDKPAFDSFLLAMQNSTERMTKLLGVWNELTTTTGPDTVNVVVNLPNGDTLATERQQEATAKLNEALTVPPRAKFEFKAGDMVYYPYGGGTLRELSEVNDVVFRVAPNVEVCRDGSGVKTPCQVVYPATAEWRKRLSLMHPCVNFAPPYTNTVRVSVLLSREEQAIRGRNGREKAFLPCYVSDVSQEVADACGGMPELVYLGYLDKLWTHTHEAKFVCPAGDNVILLEQK